MMTPFERVVGDSSKDHTVTAPTFTTRPTTEQLHRDDGFGSGAGVTRNYTDAVRGCLFVDLSVDAGVAAGRAGT